MSGLRFARSPKAFKIGTVAAALVLMHFVGSAQANMITNGGFDNFDTGNFTGWTLRLTPNGRTAVSTVSGYDIDGNGPLGISPAAIFAVGQVSFQKGVPGGILLVQNVALQGGVKYVFHADLAALDSSSGNASGGRFDLLVNNLILGVYDSAFIAGPEFGAVRATFTPALDGTFEVGLRIGRPFEIPILAPPLQFVDNVTLEPVPEPTTLLLFGTTAGVGLARWRKHRRKQQT